jgi:cytochrome c biogenesis protein CcdA
MAAGKIRRGQSVANKKGRMYFHVLGLLMFGRAKCKLLVTLLKIKACFFAILAFALAFGSDAAEAVGSGKVRIDFFGQKGCGECEKVEALALPQLEERFGGAFELFRYDVSVKENMLFLLETQDRLNVKANEPVMVVVDGTTPLCGFREIDARLAEVVEAAVNSAANSKAPPEAVPRKAGGILERRAASMTAAAVLFAGLLDGINPCVFSTLVFFMSLLAVSKVRDGRLLAVGITYCFASFITYTLLGFGLFSSLKLISQFHAARLFMDCAMAALLCVLAALSFRDAFAYARSGSAGDLTLQLPQRVKAAAHAAMKRGLSYRLLVPGAFAIGCLATLLESVCTGQVYLPALALLAKEGAEPMRWGLLIVLYNVMFAIPLVCVFALAYAGVKTDRLLKWSRMNVVPAKLLLGVLFLCLAALIFLL